MKSPMPALHLSQKLYGREQEIELLTSAFDRVRQGATEAVFVSGNPGIGKTALIQEIRKTILATDSYFISGKYDQLNKDMPYSALIQAFTELVQQLLNEQQDAAARLQTQIMQAVGANGQIIIDVIPEIEQLIGKQPAVSYTDPTESQNRFNRVMQKFVGVFAQQEHPLALFLDDLQWVDQASLNLIKVLLSDPESKHLLLIGAFRDTEVGMAHPFRHMVADLTRTGVSITATTLPPLQVEHVNTLIADLIINASSEHGATAAHPLTLLVNDLTRSGIAITSTTLPPLQAEQVNSLIAGALGCASEQSEPLARAIFRKTHGNPLFIGQMLSALQEENKIVYDVATGWKWNAEEIENLHMPASIVDLLVAKIHKLSPDTQAVLKFAACIGNRFDLEALAIINGKSAGLTLIDISTAIQEMLILPLHNEYVFSHDRIQEAVYSLLSDSEKQEMHRLIGYFVLSRTAPESRSDKIFYIADQLNLGAERIKSPEKKLELAELNFMAGRKAKVTTAFSAAAQYLTKGILLLPEESWLSQYDLTLALHMNCAECVYLSGDFDGAEKQFEVLLKNAKTNREKAEVYRIWVVLSQNRGEFRDALKHAREGLRLLGLNLPIKPSNLSVLKELLKIKWHIGNRKPADLLLLPRRDDADKQIIVDVLMHMSPAAYYYNKKIFYLIMLKIFIEAIQYGSKTTRPLGYASYGLLISAILGEYQLGYEFGQASLKLCSEVPNLSIRAQCNFAMAAFVNHWTKHLKTSNDYFTTGYAYSLESGNFFFASYCAGTHSVMKVFNGDPLDALQTQAEKYLEFLRRSHFEDMCYTIIAVLRLILCLKGKTKSSCCFSDDDFDEDVFVEKLKSEWNQFVWIIYLTLKLPLFYLFDEYSSALQFSEIFQRNKTYLLGMYYLPHHNFYYSLTLTALYPSASVVDKWSYWRRLKKNQKQMNIWAENCPENFLNKHTLVAAEMARVREEHAEAENLYDRAVILSRDNEFIQEQAIANELAGKYYLSRKDQQRARAYLEEARRCYEQWGAVAKVKHLEQNYPDLLERVVAP